MGVQLQKIQDQVIVITGATSGIGLATARLAARRGARVVMAARNAEDLEKLAAELGGAGGFVLPFEVDVADARAVDALRDAALEKFGRIDTWVNNAGISIYGKLHDVGLVEARRLFDVNFWGVVHGSRAAVQALGRRGGAIINVGSALSERVIPLQGMYAASKHAVKGYTDALRMEVEMAGLPISVTLVKPAAIDTPYVEHARNHLDTLPRNPPPIYAPDVVAQTILHCAQHPKRDVFVGGAGKMFDLLEKLVPRATDRVMEKTMDDLQRSDRPKAAQDSLFLPPLVEGRERGPYSSKPLERSAYTTMALHPLASAAAFLGVALAIGGLIAARTR